MKKYSNYLSRINFNKTNENSPFKGSFFANFFVSYDLLEEYFCNSLIYTFVSGLFSKLKFFNLIKKAFSRSCENSKILKFFGKLSVRFFEKSLRYYGVGIFFYGVFLIALNFVKLILEDQGLRHIGSNHEISSILFGLLSVVVSIFLMASQKSISQKVCTSRILNFVFFQTFFYSKKSLEQIKPVKSSHTLPVIAGIILSVLSMAFSPFLLLNTVFLFVLTWLVFLSPENGIIAVLVLLPFVSNEILFYFVFLVCSSYVIKLMRKKRVLRFSLLDTFVFFFSLNILFCGLASVNGSLSMIGSIKILIYIFFSFVVSNVIITSKLIGRIINSILFSTSILAAIGILGHFETRFSGNLLLSGVFQIISEIPFSAKEIYSEFILILFPFALAKSKIRSSESNQLSGTIALLLFAVYSLFTFEQRIILPVIIGFIIFAIVNKPVIIFVCMILCAFFNLISIAIPGLFNYIYNFIDNVTGATIIRDFVSDYALLSFDYSGFGYGSDATLRYIGTAFGYGVADNTVTSPFVVSHILQCGVISALLIAVIFLLFLNKGFSYLSSKECNCASNSKYMLAAIASVTSILIKAILFESFLSEQAILLTFVIFYLTTSLKHASGREYVPASGEAMY